MADQLVAICQQVFSYVGMLAYAAASPSFRPPPAVQLRQHEALSKTKPNAFGEYSSHSRAGVNQSNDQTSTDSLKFRSNDGFYPTKLIDPNDPIHLQDKNSPQYKRAAWYFRKMLKNEYLAYDEIDATAQDLLDVDLLSGLTLTVERTMQCPTNILKGSLVLAYAGQNTFHGDPKFDEMVQAEKAFKMPRIAHPISCSADLNYMSHTSSLSFSFDDNQFQARGNMNIGDLAYSAAITSSLTGNRANESVMHTLSTSHGEFPLTLKHQATPGGRVSILTAATVFDMFHLGAEAVHVHGNTSYWNYKFGSKIYADPTFRLDGTPHPPVGLAEWTITGNTNGDVGATACAAIHKSLSVAGGIDYTANNGEVKWSVAADVDFGNDLTFDVGFDHHRNFTVAIDTGFWGIPDLTCGFTFNIGAGYVFTPGLELTYAVTNYVYPVEQI